MNNQLHKNGNHLTVPRAIPKLRRAVPGSRSGINSGRHPQQVSAQQKSRRAPVASPGVRRRHSRIECARRPILPHRDRLCARTPDRFASWYDAVRGRLYDARGNITSDVRTITGAGAKTVAYTYSAADLVTQITYPSGRIVTYTRDTTGRITGVTTKLNAGAGAVNVATSITYQPISNLIKSLTYGNALTETAAYTLDYEQSQCTVSNGATPVSGFAITRGDSLNITGLTDTVTGGNSQTLAYSAANRLNSATGAYGSKTWIFDGVGNRTSETNAAITDSYTYPATNNKLQSIVRNAATVQRRSRTTTRAISRRMCARARRSRMAITTPTG